MRAMFCDLEHQSVGADFVRAMLLERNKVVAICSYVFDWNMV